MSPRVVFPSSHDTYPSTFNLNIVAICHSEWSVDGIGYTRLLNGTRRLMSWNDDTWIVHLDYYRLERSIGQRDGASKSFRGYKLYLNDSIRQ